MNSTIKNRKAAVFGGSLAVVTLIGGISYATIPDAGGVFHGCIKKGTLRLIDRNAGQTCSRGETAVTWNQLGPQGPHGPQGPQGPQGPAGADPNGCGDITDTIVGTWSVTNYGQETTGRVTFNLDGTYVVDNGTYEAGGTFVGNLGGTYKVVERGGAILFDYENWTTGLPWDRIAVVQCGAPDRIVTSVAGHTHGYESLTRTD